MSAAVSVWAKTGRAMTTLARTTRSVLIFIRFSIRRASGQRQLTLHAHRSMMESMRYFFVSAVLVCTLPRFVFAAVVVNEIAWMGTAVSTADEWMELANDGGTTVDLTGWRLDAADGTPSIALAGSIPAGGFFLLERTNDETVSGVTADLIYTGALGNNGETLVLKDAGGAAVHTVDASGGWPAGDNTTKDTMQRSGSSWITASPTPRTANAGGPAPAPPPPPPAAASTPPTPEPVPVPAPPPAPSLGANAGADLVAIAGAITQFEGLAFGLDGKPLEGTRYFWNFGDGSTQEAQSPTHIFHFPGTYHVNLLVSFGHYTGSDWLAVTVLPAEISISEVQPGEGGFVEIANASVARLDIGGMFLTDDTRFVFRIPAGTVIGPKSAVVLPGANTRLTPTTYLDLRDARGVTLDTVRFSGSLSSGASWERDGYNFRPQSNPTPGKLVTPGAAGQTITTVPRTSPVVNPLPVPLPRRTVEQAPAVGEPAFVTPSSTATPAAAAVGASGVMPAYAFLGASIILGLMTAAGIVVLKRMGLSKSNH